MATLKVGTAPENEASQEAKESWYADAEGNLTNDAAEASFHVAEKGQLIQPLMVKKYGFVDGAPGDRGKKGSDDQQEKVVKSGGPTEDKAVGGSGRRPKG